MGKHKKKRKSIGRKYEHCIGGLRSHMKIKSSPISNQSHELPHHIISEHNYANVPTSNATCNQIASCDPACDYTGNFKCCDCVVHHEHGDDKDDDQCVKEHDNADEYLLVLGSSVIKLETEDDIDRVTYQQLRMDCEQKEEILNRIGFEVMKTTADLTLIQFYEKRFFSIKMAVTVDREFSVLVTVHGKLLSGDHPIFARTRTVRIFNDLVMFLKGLDEFTVCIGNPDISYGDMLPGKASIEHDHGAVYSQTIRGNQCTLLTDLTNRCSHCSRYRGTLQRAGKKKSCEVALSSNRPNSSMTKEDLIKKAEMLRKKCDSIERKNKQLLMRQEIDQKNKNNEMLEDTTGEISGIVHEGTSALEEMFPDPESFKRMFWEEQLKFNKDKHQMRWHPLIVKCEMQS